MRHFLPLVLSVVLPVQAWASYASSYGASEDEPSAPAPRASSSELTVRPDVLRAGFSVRARNPEVDRAAYSAKVAVEELSRRIKATFGEAATVTPRGASVSQAASTSKANQSPLQEVVVDGVLEIALPAGDFWARAKVLGEAEKLRAELMDAAREGKPGYWLAISSIHPARKDPEAHRKELLERWLARARELAAVANEGKPLELLNCQAPGLVTIRTLSLEEVELSLEVRCTLGQKRP